MISDENKKQLYTQLARDEGKKLLAYTDTVGIRTVGIGHNFQTVPFTSNQCWYIFDRHGTVTFQEANKFLTEHGLSEAQCEQLFVDDLEKHSVELLEKYPKLFIHGEIRGCVLINMAFNLGVGGLLKFKNTLAQFEIGRFDVCATMMKQSLWAKQVGNRAVRLANQMQTGQWA